MATWFELAPPAVRDEFISLFAHHDNLTITGFDHDNEISYMRANDGTIVIFDMLKAEARGALIDDDAAVKFFARIIKGIKQRDQIMEVEFSQSFDNLKKRDETLFNEVMKRFCANSHNDTNIPLWNKIMDKLGLSCYVVRKESDD